MCWMWIQGPSFCLGKLSCLVIQLLCRCVVDLALWAQGVESKAKWFQTSSPVIWWYHQSKITGIYLQAHHELFACLLNDQFVPADATMGIFINKISLNSVWSCIVIHYGFLCILGWWQQIQTGSRYSVLPFLAAGPVKVKQGTGKRVFAITSSHHFPWSTSRLQPFCAWDKRAPRPDRAITIRILSLYVTACTTGCPY